MKNKKIILTLSIIIVLVLTIGVTYAFYTYTNIGKNQVLISGDIYLNYQETNEIRLENAIPLSKEEALIQTNNSFKFTITGKNTSNKDIYYAISVVEGDSIENKSRIKPSDINLYLKENEEVVVDGLRYESFDNTNIWINKIPAKTNNQVVINYELKMWIDSGVKIGNASDNNYSLEDWNNSYQSIKVNVNANLSAMNLPIVVEPDQVENNKSYFIATIRNYDNPDEEGEILDVADKMNLAINNENNNVLFTYKDSLGNEDTEKKQSLNLEYDFTKKQSVAVQVYMESVNDANQDADVIVKSTKNNDEVYSLVKKMSIKGNNYCLNNGFNKLSDCILVSENMSSSVEDAKTFINNKGNVNLNDTAPTYTYVEDTKNDISGSYMSQIDGFKYYVGDNYNFDTKKGMFELVNNDNSSILSVDLDDSYLNYYTCGTINMQWFDCSNIYKIKEILNGKITKADLITYKEVASLNSEQGLYKIKDENNLDMYFYRGNVINNNVYFAGFYWKILRINGDGSIKLIYNGDNKTEDNIGINGEIYAFNENIYDATYVGYMYGKNFSKTELTSDVLEYPSAASAFTPSIKYYFADSYTYNENTNSFTLKMKNASETMKYATVGEMKDKFSEYPYTCFSTTEDGSCNLLINVIKYISDNILNIKFKSYTSTSYEGTRTNEVDSTAKKVIDNWYKENISSKNYNNFVVDGVFCNDRRIASGDGFSLSKITNYKAYAGITNSSVDLTCDIKDKFSVSTNIGNGKLTYPVALITKDEIRLAGGKGYVRNSKYFLNSSDKYYTMTPVTFLRGKVDIYSNNPVVGIYAWMNSNIKLSLRPVLNISKNIYITSGDGTINNPFMLTLNTRVINE